MKAHSLIDDERESIVYLGTGKEIFNLSRKLVKHGYCAFQCEQLMLSSNSVYMLDFDPDRDYDFIICSAYTFDTLVARGFIKGYNMNIYGLTKKTTVDYKKGVVLNDEQCAKWKAYELSTAVRVIGPVDIEGYMPNDMNFVAPYIGRYGMGLVVCEPEYWQGRKSTKYMRMTYIILNTKK